MDIKFGEEGQEGMDSLVTQYLDKMLEFEEGGYVGEALALSGKLLEAFP